MNDEMRILKTLFIQLRSNIFGKKKRNALCNIEKIFNLLNIVKNKVLVYDFLFVCTSQIKSLVQDKKFNQAFDLVDCIHVVPDIVESPHRDWKMYWDTYVEKYMDAWDSLFLLQFKEQILSLDIIV